MPPFISKRFFGGSRISRNVAKRTQCHILCRQLMRCRLTLSSHYALNTVANANLRAIRAVRGRFPVTGTLSDAYIVDIAGEDASDRVYENEPQEVPTTSETRNAYALPASQQDSIQRWRPSIDAVLRSSRTPFWDQMRTRNGRA